MASLSPLQIALLIVGLLSLVGVVVTFVRSRMTYTGYEDILNDVKRIGMSMRGEIFRDGGDVVVSGSWQGNPVVVRFSNEENTPGLNIRMPAAASFLLSVAPAGAEVTEGGRIPVKTTDDLFDARFTTRTDQPTHAKMLIDRRVTGLFAKLACSKNTYLALGNGAIELSELIVPSPNPAKHVVEHLKEMAALAAALREMPGAETVRILKIEHERHVAARVAMVFGIIVAVGSIIAATQVPKGGVHTGANDTLSNGILPIDATNISDAGQFHVLPEIDMDETGKNWLRGYGKTAVGRLQGDFSGSGTGNDVAYLLQGPNDQRRVVIIANHQNRYDGRFPYIGLIARIPKDLVSSIQWVGDKPPVGMIGDGLLLVRAPNDAQSGVVIFLTESGVISAVPKNFGNIELQ